MSLTLKLDLPQSCLEKNQEVSIQLRKGHKSRKVSLLVTKRICRDSALLETDRNNASTSLNIKGLLAKPQGEKKNLAHSSISNCCSSEPRGN